MLPNGVVDMSDEELPNEFEYLTGDFERPFSVRNDMDKTMIDFAFFIERQENARRVRNRAIFYLLVLAATCIWFALK